MVSLPRLVIGAPASSQGKTTITLGLLAALRAAGHSVAPFKVGPDYIDPGYHTLAAGRVGRNLDAHLCGEELIVPLLLHGAATPAPADLAIIEGVMGLFDGQLGRSDGGRGAFGSTAHVATLVSAPVLLVVDGSHTSRTIAAVIHGLATFDPRVRVGGVILNRVRAGRSADETTAAIEDAGVRVLGVVPPDGTVGVPSRHLGLIPADERSGAIDAVAAAASLVADHVDLEAVLALAASASDLDADPWTPPVRPVSGRPRIAVAAGPAFTFRYAETTELLQAAGCEVVRFDPLSDDALPPDTSGLYLGGGFPEEHAEALTARTSLRAEIADAVAAGLPTVAECAGLLYLCESVDGVPMTGALPLRAAMGPRLTLGYHTAVSPSATLLTRAGDEIRSHEFHRTQVTPVGAALPSAWTVGDRTEGVTADPADTGRPTLHASYQHVHWAGHPRLAQRFADAAAAFASSGRRWDVPSASDTPTPGATPDLAHHGDRDLRPGLIDLAVNVRTPRPPDDLVSALAGRAGSWAAYPDPAPARAALAAAHGVAEEMVLPTAGAAEAFTLIARGIAGRRPVVVYPQFTVPEQALRAAGRSVGRVMLTPEDDFRLDPARVDAVADLVFVGNPTNPTGVLHPAEVLRTLVRGGRVLVVDEAFLDAVPGEPETLIAPDMTGVVVLRSITKTWGVAGLRAGYVVGDPALIALLADQQPPWPVSTPSLDALVACSGPDARARVARWASEVAPLREAMVAALGEVGFACVPSSAPFVLVDTSPAGRKSVREALAARGFAVRRCETFPGLGPAWIRVAVRDRITSQALATALAALKENQ